MSHYFLKPIQRLPQYKLLLEDYLRNLNTNSPDYDDTAAALTIVTQAADHANETIKQTVNHRNSYWFLNFIVSVRINSKKCWTFSRGSETMK